MTGNVRNTVYPIVGGTVMIVGTLGAAGMEYLAFVDGDMVKLGLFSIGYLGIGAVIAAVTMNGRKEKKK